MPRRPSPGRFPAPACTPTRSTAATGRTRRPATGYRAFAREVLTRLPLDANSDDFVFDSQLLAQMRWFGYLIAEVTCPTRYSPEASSIGLGGSIRYGIGCVRTAIIYRLAKMRLVTSPLFPYEGAQGKT